MPTRSAAVAATLAAAALWGTSFSVNDVALRSVSPATFVVLRFAIAAAVLLAYAAWTSGAHARLARDPLVWIVGGLNGLGFVAQSFGQCWTTPARTALFVNANIFLVAGLSVWVLKETPRRRTFVAAVIAFVGVAFLSLQQGQPGACGAAWWGDAIILAGTFAWALYLVLNRRLVTTRGEPMTAIVAWTFVATTAVATPALLLDAAPMRVPVGIDAWPVLYSAIGTTLLPFFLWTFALRAISATASAVIVLSEVLVAIAISLAIGRETFTPLSVLGAVVLFASVAWTSVAQARD